MMETNASKAPSVSAGVRITCHNHQRGISSGPIDAMTSVHLSTFDTIFYDQVTTMSKLDPGIAKSTEFVHGQVKSVSHLYELIVNCFLIAIN